jgi:AraC family transcriptional regulator of adaptative response / DNA-3-methyladenine glycosylase II
MNSQQYFEALIARDQRFDGVFFVGVKTTGIYCRPICPSRRPQMRHCEFFRLAAAAEVAGYRPCLRCRPELAPGNAPIDTEQRVVGAALRYLDRMEETNQTIPELASAFRFSDRHFRRLLTNQLGVSPIQLMQTRRLLLAKQLLTDTNLSINDVALASGFKSLRRFNSLFKERYRLSPTGLRNGSKKTTVDGSECTFHLSYRPPFCWKTLLRYFRRRSYRGAEFAGESEYFRTVGIGKLRGWVVIGNDPNTHRLKVQVAPGLLSALLPLVSRLRRLFDLDASPDQIAAALGPLASENPGIRVPGAFDGFEIAMRAVLGQQISVPAATTIAGRVVERFGEKIETPFPDLKFLVPTESRANGSARSDPGSTSKGSHPRANQLSQRTILGGKCKETNRGARDWALDSRLHSNAGVGMAGRFSAPGSRPAEGAFSEESVRRFGPFRKMATMACLCCHAALEFVGGTT